MKNSNKTLILTLLVTTILTGCIYGTDGNSCTVNVNDKSGARICSPKERQAAFESQNIHPSYPGKNQSQ